MIEDRSSLTYPSLAVTRRANRANSPADGVHYVPICHFLRSGSDKVYHSVVQDSSGLIARLLLFCRPSTIGWFIVPVIVDAIYRIFWRGLRPHVFVKVCKAIIPTVANLNAARTVYRIFRACRGIAAVFHMRPASIFRGPLLTARYHTMLGARRCDLNGLLASAAFRVACAKVGRLYDLLFSAITLAQPSCHSRQWLGKTKNCQIAVSFTGYIHYLAHISMIGHLRPIVKWERNYSEAFQ